MYMQDFLILFLLYANADEKREPQEESGYIAKQGVWRGQILGGAGEKMRLTISIN